MAVYTGPAATGNGGSIRADSVARVVYTLEWRSALGRHQEHVHAGRANFWRDIFPAGLREGLMGLEAGGEAAVELGVDAPAWDQGQLQELPRSAFRPPFQPSEPLQPRLGRFYPLGVLGGLPGVYPQDSRPFRVTGLGERTLTVDRNPPLAAAMRGTATVRARVLEVMAKGAETGGQCRHVVECLSQWGPGMQAPWFDVPTDFDAPGDLRRDDEAADAAFYQRPRLVAHVDACCRGLLQQVHAGLLAPGMRVLDLMAGWQSHLDRCQGLEVTGLGMNAEEMAANPALAGHVAHDLNADPRLPFADAGFQAVVCALSVEYLARPVAVLAEVARVLAPGGVLVVSFSHRWFPAKAVRLWTRLHDFERLGLVAHWLGQAGGFQDLETLSFRGWPRPWDPEDRYVDRLKSADPLFAVAARRAA